MTNTTSTYGLLLRRYSQHGYDNIALSLVERRTVDGVGGDAPRNPPSSYDMPARYRGLRLEDLGLEGWFSSYPPHDFLCDGAAYRGVYKVDADTAAACLRTLKLIDKQVERDAAREPADILASLCAALRLTFVCEQVDNNFASSYDAHQWRWLTIGEGRNRYRQMIREGREKATARGNERGAAA